MFRKVIKEKINNNSNKLPLCVFKGLPSLSEGDYIKLHITKEMVKEALPKINDADAEAFVKEINSRGKEFHLDSKERLSHFFGQIRIESANGGKVEEDFYYKSLGALSIFRYFRQHKSKAIEILNEPYAKKKIDIPKFAYGHGEKAKELGNLNEEDGYNFAGKGFKQLTGRDNYAKFNKWHRNKYQEEVDFLKNPELVAKPPYNARSAIYFWDDHNLYKYADKDDANAISRILNPGDISTFPRRKQYTDKNLNSRIFSEDKIKSFDADLYQKNLQYILKRPDCAFSLPSPINTSFYSGFIDAEQDSSPLIIDLDGDGVKSIALNHSSVFFDLDNDGFAEKTAWVGPHDGLLVRDLNHNGIIDNGSELFGNHTFCADGQLAHNGFEALQSYQDGGGLLTASSSPKLWKELMIWQDRNSNGRTDQGELTPLSATGIKSIDLNYRLSSWRDRAGNSHRQ